MNKNVMTMLAAFLAASTITTAADTLRIESVRTANLCSSDTTFLLTGSIGEVFFSDSLMYFDITLRYDTSVLRPTQGFPSGTIAGQLDFGEYNPAFDFRTPGEIGVSAFSISTPAKGNMPLFAIGGMFVGDCKNSDSITVPFPIDFNEEFKRKVTTYISERFETVAIPIVRQDLGVQFSDQEIVINHPDSTQKTMLDFHISGLQGTTMALTVVMDSAANNGITIDSVNLVGATPDSIVHQGDDTVIVYYLAPLGSLQAEIVLSTNHTHENDSTTVIASLQSFQECGCITPAKTDSLKVRTHKTTVSALSDVDEDSVTISMMEDAIEVQGVHGQPGFLTVYSLNGAILYRNSFEQGADNVRIPIHDLPHGVYVVTATWGGLTLTNKLLK